MISNIFNDQFWLSLYTKRWVWQQTPEKDYEKLQSLARLLDEIEYQIVLLRREHDESYIGNGLIIFDLLINFRKGRIHEDEKIAIDKAKNVLNSDKNLNRPTAELFQEILEHSEKNKFILNDIIFDKEKLTTGIDNSLLYVILFLNAQEHHNSNQKDDKYLNYLYKADNIPFEPPCRTFPYNTLTELIFPIKNGTLSFELKNLSLPSKKPYFNEEKVENSEKEILNNYINGFSNIIHLYRRREIIELGNQTINEISAAISSNTITIFDSSCITTPGDCGKNKDCIDLFLKQNRLSNNDIPNELNNSLCPYLCFKELLLKQFLGDLPHDNYINSYLSFFSLFASIDKTHLLPKLNQLGKRFSYYKNKEFSQDTFMDGSPEISGRTGKRYRDRLISLYCWDAFYMKGERKDNAWSNLINIFQAEEPNHSLLPDSIKDYKNRILNTLLPLTDQCIQEKRIVKFSC